MNKFMKKTALFLSFVLLLMSFAVLQGCSKKETTSDIPVKNVVIEVVHKDQSKKTFDVKTTKDTLADALTEQNIAEGENSEYGLFITKVDGETANSANQEWWCITKDGQSLSTGASSTNISDGDKYELTLTIGY